MIEFNFTATVLSMYFTTKGAGTKAADTVAVKFRELMSLRLQLNF